MPYSIPVNLRPFMGPQQTKIVNLYLQGEEAGHFEKVMDLLSARIENMSVSYQQDGLGNEAIVWLHYFHPAGDWWILEKDIEADQHQAFGFVCLGGDTQNAELGYISIPELLSVGAELDFYWTPKPLLEVKTKLNNQE